MEVNKSDCASGLQGQSSPRSPVRRLSGPPKKSVASRLWDLLQPLARLWGLVTAVGRWSYTIFFIDIESIELDLNLTPNLTFFFLI